MQFNDGKFECMRHGANNELKESTHYLTKAGDVIKTADHVKDLGVWMSSDGSFNKHIRNGD